MSMRRLGWLLLVGFVLTLVGSGESRAAPAAPQVPVPPELSDWVEWVKEVEPEPGDCREVDEVTICVWPSYLTLEVEPEGASFAMEVWVFGPSEVELPGSTEQWPQDVRVDDKTRAVLREGAIPTVELTEGRHTLSGFIPWREAPDSLEIPESIGLVDLRIGGTAVPFPSRTGTTLSLEDPDALLEPEPEPEPEQPDEDVPDSETIEVSRRLLDGVPLQITTRLDIHIGGKPRELRLPNPLLDGSTLLQITAPVPIERGDDGGLILQVRPGTLTVELTAALPRSPTQLRPPKHPAPWPDDEVWVWNAAASGDPSMGQVSLSGAQAVDHARTHAPSEWQGGATYRIDPSGALQFEILQRGVSETSTNRLMLDRQMRIDLAGTGWTVLDRLGGTMNTGNRLDLRQDGGVLGSVVTDGQPQVITVSDDGHAGVEVRGSSVDIHASWRLEGGTSQLPLGGWSEDFDQVTLGFMLPRGWDLLHADGPGSLGPTWFGAWRPLDLIVLLGVVVLLVRIINPWAGLAALVGLGLAYTRNGDGYVLLLALVAALTVMVIPLRRQRIQGVRVTVRTLWAMAAFIIGAWVVWRVPAGVAAVWRDGLSGLAHVRLEDELSRLAQGAVVLGVIVGGLFGLAAISARASKVAGRVAPAGVAGVLGLALVASVLTNADDHGVLSTGSSRGPSRDFSEVGERQQMIAAAPEAPAEAEPEPEYDYDDEREFRHKGEEGVMGKPTSKSKSGLYAMKGPKTDPGAFAVGNDDEDVWGGLTGTEVGESFGVGGLGLVGTGRGGGGTGEGTIGLGNTGLIGKGGGGGTGSGYGQGSGAGFGGRGKKVPRVRQGKAEIRGDLDRDIVRRIVRAHINEVRHCYNQGLARDPSLSGKVTVQFTITADGTVSASTVQQTSLADKAVGGCIAKSVRRWKFPKPPGGGNVVVSYPFTVNAGGGAPGGPEADRPAEDRFVAKNVALPELEAPAVPQTGAGMPGWSGPRWTVSLDRTVKSDESITLWVVTPLMSRILSVVRALALLFLVFVLLREGWLARPDPSDEDQIDGDEDADDPAARRMSSAASAGGAAVVGLMLWLTAGPAAAAPPAEMLEELAERVNAERPLAPSPECDPECALLGKLEVAVKGDRLALRAEVHMAGPGVWALPGSVGTWIPRTVRVDDAPARAMALFEDQLLLHLGPGLHTIELSGPIGAEQLDLDLAGAAKHVEVTADGWTVDGVDDDDLAESLHFERTDSPSEIVAEPSAEEPPSEDEDAEAAEDRRSQDMGPWFAVERYIKIGPRWTVDTTVTRLHHGPSPAKLHVPLLPGERMLEATGKVDDPKATVTLRSSGESIAWTSVLEPSTSLQLRAPSDRAWTETWAITCAGAWQCSDSGTPATMDDGGTRVFHPWPQESLQLSFFEPGPAEGQLLTVDHAVLDLELGETGTDAHLRMKVRTTTVTERTITLPDGAHVGTVKVDDADVPMAKDATELRLTFQPGLHQVRIDFKLDSAAAWVVHAPVVTLGGRAVDARVTFKFSDASDRVIVWTTGDGVGPMVWLWPYIGVLALLAVVLARFTRPPLHALQWFLLSIGFSVLVLPLVWGWFWLVEARQRYADRLEEPLRFNVAQIVLGLATLTVLGLVLLTAKDLLTAPVSTIVHNWSEGGQLSWYYDRSEGSTPAATVVTVSTSLWRALWAGWVVWLAWSSITWGKWAYGIASQGGWLRSRPALLVEDDEPLSPPASEVPTVGDDGGLPTAEAQPSESPEPSEPSESPEPTEPTDS